MFAWFKKLFKSKQELSLEKFEEQFDKDFKHEQEPKKGFKSANNMMVETHDQLLAEVITQAFLSGNTVVGNRDEDGNETIREVK